MSVQKTRALLVDVARQLFAKNGFEDTSMNDIAVAANRGRRTLYTYFNSKEEIYLAVIQTELERLYERMEEVARKPIQPEEKMVQLIFAHLEVMKEAVYRNGNLRAEFFRDVWKVESVRKTFDKNDKDDYHEIKEFVYLWGFGSGIGFMLNEAECYQRIGGLLVRTARS